MKPNYALYLILFLIILFRGSLITIINNLGSLLYPNNNNLEITILKNKYNNLNNEYNNLLSFKNNINIKDDYIITNPYLNNYGYNKLLINGTNYQMNDEVVTTEGLIGIISNIYDKYSEVSYIYKVNISVKINENYGKITGHTKDNNIIISQLSNYNNININDKVYSIYNTYIGKVISINKGDIDTIIICQTVNLNNIHYVAVLSRQS